MNTIRPQDSFQQTLDVSHSAGTNRYHSVFRQFPFYFAAVGGGGRNETKGKSKKDQCLMFVEHAMISCIYERGGEHAEKYEHTTAAGKAFLTLILICHAQMRIEAGGSSPK